MVSAARLAKGMTSMFYERVRVGSLA